jgi:type VI secretion system protein ImpI
MLTDFSSNGTRLNGQVLVRMEPVIVSSGDEIEIGPYVIAVGRDDGWSNHLGDKTVISKRSMPAMPGDKTVLARLNVPTPRPPGETILPRSSKKPQPAAVSKPAPALRADASSRQFVDAFCEGAALDPEIMAGRGDMELAHELGTLMRRFVGGMQEMSQMIGELRAVVGSQEKSAMGILGDNVSSLGTAAKRKQAERLLAMYFGNLRADGAGAEEMLVPIMDDAVRHNKALFDAMQTALFTLLNELSPPTIERDTKTGVIRSKASKNWNAYVHKWEQLNTGGEDGMLDVFLRYFGEAYDRKMQNL